MFRLKNARILSSGRYSVSLYFRGSRQVIRVRRGHLRQHASAIYVTAWWFSRALAKQQVSESWGAVWPVYCKRCLLPTTLQWRPETFTAAEAKGLTRLSSALGLSPALRDTLANASLLGLRALRGGYRWWDIQRRRARRRMRNILGTVLQQYVVAVADRAVITGEHYCRILDAVGGLERRLFSALAQLSDSGRSVQVP